jgi:hypothetical protein
MASANKKFTPLKKCACNLHELQHIVRVLLAAVVLFSMVCFTVHEGLADAVFICP